VREAAARTQCANHLKQMALACHNYEGVFKVMPTAGRQDCGTCGRDPLAPTGNGPTQHWSWRYQILPYIDQNNVFVLTSNATIRSTPMTVFSCPTRRPPTVIGAISTADYAANAGSNWCPADSVAVWTGVIVPGMLNNINIKVGLVRIAAISDGTSNTLMLGEKYVPKDRYTTGDTWGDNETWAGGNSWGHTRCANQQPRQDAPYSNTARGAPPANAAANAGKCGPWGLGTSGGYFDFWGSAHSGGFQVAMADGTVRMLRYDITLAILRALHDRADGAAVNFNDL
jgi:hypothetical protein